MKKERNRDKRNSIVLGIWVFIGSLLMVLTVFFIGSRKYLFSSTFSLTAIFSDVQGLQKGNLVRFRGMDVGTVKKMKVESDSDVKVIIKLESEIKPYIKKNAIASIVTDGLMGNKILIIQNQDSASPAIEENDVLRTLPPLDLNKVFRKLAKTNDNVTEITNELKTATKNLNNKNSLLTVLSDTVLGKKVKSVDTVFVNNLSATMKNVKWGSYKFNQNMEALKHNFLFRRYFKKQEKEKEKEKKKEEKENKK